MSFKFKLILLACIIVSIASLIGYTIHAIATISRLETLNHVEEANKKAEKAAQKGQSQVDRCYTTGGEWNRSRGMCETAPRQ